MGGAEHQRRYARRNPKMRRVEMGKKKTRDPHKSCCYRRGSEGENNYSWHATAVAPDASSWHAPRTVCACTVFSFARLRVSHTASRREDGGSLMYDPRLK